jgi:hypothetical protein
MICRKIQTKRRPPIQRSHKGPFSSGEPRGTAGRLRVVRSRPLPEHAPGYSASAGPVWLFVGHYTSAATVAPIPDPQPGRL